MVTVSKPCEEKSLLAAMRMRRRVRAAPALRTRES
jgi:hypothetical protein